ncbi:MAG TPA: nucleotidyltransferase domain-containing protein [Thermoanaerobaculia bacterium]|nr:nucleotidyltransferase domain-containing protein [Thermoanaerobaculia bacterium]
MEAAALSPREYHARRERERQDERESLRQDVLERVRQSIRTHAPRFPAIRAVYLFGSLVQPGRFTSGSDVDLAVDVDDIQVETPFWRALEEELERNVDLRPRAGAVARAVESYGELCYEREVGPPGK